MKKWNIILALLLVTLHSCSREFQDEASRATNENIDDLSSIIVPDGHDLRPVNLQNASIILSDESIADMVKIRVYKVEGETNKLLLEGAVEKHHAFNTQFLIPNHTETVLIEADLATNTRQYYISPDQLENFILTDDIVEESEEAGRSFPSDDPPSWNCDDYSEFNGNDGGNYKITGNVTQGINVNSNTKIYICSGGSWTPSYLNDNSSKLTIYVGQGGTLNLSGTINSKIYNEGTFNGVNANIAADLDNWGLTSITGNLSVSDHVQNFGGTINISGSFNNNEHFKNEGGSVVIGGHVTLSDKFDNKEDSELIVAGNFTINSGKFKNYCKTTISGTLINNDELECKNASYTLVTGAFMNNSNKEVKVKEGSIFKCASIISSGNIKGDNAYSIIETGALTFNGGKKFKGELDICSNSYTSSMGDNDVINTCSTFISSSSCSPGYNNMVDNDGDGCEGGLDVDDNNPDIATYNYPQGQGLYFTSVYEDLYPCQGDYDFNDLVNNYSYKEGLNNGDNHDGQNTYITTIEFNYKFPALGGGYNNSFVLRVIDGDNDAVLTLDASDSYDSSHITRLHDNNNGTTLFVFANLKSIYVDNPNAIINSRQIDYANIPVISGTVTKLNGAYDEFLLRDGVSGQEIHHLYNAIHINYPALNLPSMYNDDSNFSECDDLSTGSNLFVNANGFPWALNDLPIDWPWPKENTTILEAYPNFDDFVTSNPNLDWYSDANGNRNNSKLIFN